jgi:hypothetical protein
MTPAPARRADRLEQLADLEAGDRIRYQARPATILERPHATRTPIAGVDLVELEALFDDRDQPELVIASADNLDTFELLPAPRIYDQEA